ncbi:signal recognition particle-docking protein FtsY [Luteimonas sp. 50]|uniref:Signal recognition particle receptor FtsY n=1 Tax=Cognatiluteimonas sedimenti TaxID=2927791 RepID=A0ABT0A4R6_9GAMM|nr:signal recognition particle-docking protein FtsY [Lysobacter sedimenti]MCJ0825967.1 signal recognition particle-docking protein FtsY [Lysobacter sedimenti]
MPANRSSTRAPARPGCSQLNRVSRTRSLVGRRPGASATARRVPRQRPPMMRTLPDGPLSVRRLIGPARRAVLPCAPFCAMVPTMVSFFRRKKPPAAAVPATDAAPGARLDIEALAAAFPAAPAAATTTPGAESPAPAGAPAGAAAGSGTGETAGTTDAGSGDAAAPGAPGWRERLRGSGFARSFGGLFSRHPKLDDELLDEIETALLTADVGVAATTQLVDDLRKRMKAREFADANALLAALRGELVALLAPVAVPLQVDAGARPFVLLTVGVNGVGKTTTIGKLARRFKDQGHSLMLAAGDTFRAAAVAQLQAWGERNGVPVVAQGQDADAASVAFDALQAAQARGIDILIADTAGRLHTQQGLMAELGKIRRVLGKLDPAAPHEVLMVIDGTTGQNALSQLRQFHAAVGVTGLVVTKLDGTAKGGVVFALAREFGIPIRYAGIGERPEDLRVFDAQAFVDALLPASLGG